MYACICHAVTDDEVVDAVGAGATTLEAVGGATRAGTTCGGCHDTLDDLIDACVACPLRDRATSGSPSMSRVA